MYRIALMALTASLTGSYAVSAAEGKSFQRMVCIESWSLRQASVSVPENSSLKVRQNVEIYGKGHPTTVPKLANTVLIRFKQKGSILPAPAYNEVKDGKRMEKRIEIYYYDWQLPAVIALFQKIGQQDNSSGGFINVACQYNRTLDKGTGEYFRTGDCHSWVSNSPC